MFNHNLLKNRAKFEVFAQVNLVAVTSLYNLSSKTFLYGNLVSSSGVLTSGVQSKSSTLAPAPAARSAGTSSPGDHNIVNRDHLIESLESLSVLF